MALPDPPPPSIAYVHTLHARAAASAQVPPELLLAIAYKESRYDPRAKPQCGVTQIAATKDRARCALLRRNTQAAYDAAEEHLQVWLGYSFCRRQGMPCALTGYGKGTTAARSGKPDKYALNTLRLARQLIQ